MLHTQKEEILSLDKHHNSHTGMQYLSPQALGITTHQPLCEEGSLARQCQSHGNQIELECSASKLVLNTATCPCREHTYPYPGSSTTCPYLSSYLPVDPGR